MPNNCNADLQAIEQKAKNIVQLLGEDADEEKHNVLTDELNQWNRKLIDFVDEHAQQLSNEQKARLKKLHHDITELAKQRRAGIASQLKKITTGKKAIAVYNKNHV